MAIEYATHLSQPVVNSVMIGKVPDLNCILQCVNPFEITRFHNRTIGIGDVVVTIRVGLLGQQPSIRVSITSELVVIDIDVVAAYRDRQLLYYQPEYQNTCMPLPKRSCSRSSSRILSSASYCSRMFLIDRSETISS
jgi:hypothetical protein